MRDGRNVRPKGYDLRKTRKTDTPGGPPLYPVPLPPHYRQTAHVLHSLMTLGTLGLWGIVWLINYVINKKHNDDEAARYNREVREYMAIADAQHTAKETWLLQEVSRSTVAAVQAAIGPVRPRPRPPMVVNAGPPMATRARPFVSDPADRPPFTRTPVMVEKAPAQVLPVQQAPSPVKRDARPSGRHRPPGEETTAMPAIS